MELDVYQIEHVQVGLHSHEIQTAMEILTVIKLHVLQQHDQRQHMSIHTIGIKHDHLVFDVAQLKTDDQGVVQLHTG